MVEYPEIISKSLEHDLPSGYLTVRHGKWHKIAHRNRWFTY